MHKRFLAAAAVIAVAVFGAGTANAGKVEIKGAHICCGNCVNAITGLLKKVDGVADGAAEKKGSITFTTKDDKTTTAALGAATDDGKEVKIDLVSPKAGDKVDTVTVTNTHVCCDNCKTALKALFPDDKLEFPDKKTVKINGKDLDKAAVLDALRKAGWNGKIS